MEFFSQMGQETIICGDILITYIFFLLFIVLLAIRFFEKERK